MTDYTITWKGTQHTNKSSRRGQVPAIIVDHITEGSAASAIDWFTNPINTVSSAHFLVTKEGEIFQFVAIEDNAWSNGLSTSDLHIATASIVQEKGVNPNWYTVSIEHEGIYADTKGELTSKQLQATIWLHRYIIDYVKEHWGTDIPVDRDHILGHYQIDPIRKPNCPGEYPFEEVIQGVVKEPSLKIEDIQGHWAEEYIKQGIIEGLFTGFPDGTFRPNQQVTRAELAAALVRLVSKGR